MRLTRHTLRVLAADQHLAQHVKIPSQHTQPHIAAVTTERVIAAVFLAIARLQRTDRRLHPRMTPPGLAELRQDLDGRADEAMTQWEPR